MTNHDIISVDINIRGGSEQLHKNWADLGTAKQTLLIRDLLDWVSLQERLPLDSFKEMSPEPNRSAWYHPSEQQPWQSGVYQIQRRSDSGLGYAYYNKSIDWWYRSADTIEQALSPFSGVSVVPFFRWRGLASDPAAKEPTKSDVLRDWAAKQRVQVIDFDLPKPTIKDWADWMFCSNIPPAKRAWSRVPT